MGRQGKKAKIPKVCDASCASFEASRVTRVVKSGVYGRYFQSRFPSGIGVSNSEDLVQELCTRVLSAGREPRADDEFDRWAMALAKCLCVDQLRRTRRERLAIQHVRQRESEGQNSDTGVVADASEPDLQWAELWRELRPVLRELPEHYHIAFLLRHEEQLTLEQVARLMRRTPQSVKGLLKRGTRMIRVRLERQGWGGAAVGQC